MKVLSKAILPALIASALAGNAWAQEECVELEGAPPGMYVTTDEGLTFMEKDGEIIELGPGEAGFADENKITCIKRPPRFLDWPCATDAAMSRKFGTYRWEDLQAETPAAQAEEVVSRYFSIPEVIEPIPNWLEGEYNSTFEVEDVIQFSSPEYWYHADPGRPIMDEKRPKILLISLYVGLNKVVLDNNMIAPLQEFYGDSPIPVAFIFNDSNVVPVSYFGPNVSLEEILKASKERGIKLADPPIWWLGDYHLSPTISEFEKFFDIPPLEDIPAEKQAKLRADLEAKGFTAKPIIVSLFSEAGEFAVDQPQRVRVAASMGYEKLPVTIVTIEPDTHLARCGPGTPLGMDSGTAISGGTTPDSGATVPPSVPVNPPEPEASDS